MSLHDRFQDWISPMGITQLRGEAGTGKTTMMLDLAETWQPFVPNLGEGKKWYFCPDQSSVAPGRLPPDLAGLTVPNLEDLAEAFKHANLTGQDLVLIDDVQDFSVNFNSGVAVSAKTWLSLFQYLNEKGCTVVVAGRPRQSMHAGSRETLSTLGKSGTFFSSVILDLIDLVRTEEGGVVVEISAWKDRRKPPGIRGRFWVRPLHDTPVLRT